MPFTNYLNDGLLSHVFVRDVTFTPPSGCYLAAYTDAPSELGTDGTEVSGGSYARQAITFEFSVTEGRIVNNGAISISNMPACAVVALAVFDAATGGNMLAYGLLNTPAVLGAGDPLAVADGLLGIVL
jgi:hypothetical protein